MARILEFPQRNSREAHSGHELPDGCLGADPQAAIGDLIYQFMLEKHEFCKGDLFRIRRFSFEHDSVVEWCFSRLAEYESACTAYRKANGMRPFNWCYEDRESIRSVFRRKPNKAARPDYPEERVAYWDRRSMKEKSNVYPWNKPFRTLVAREHLLYKRQADSPVAGFHRDAVSRGVDPAPGMKCECRPGSICRCPVDFDSYPGARVTFEGSVSVLHDVSQRYIASGVFDSVRNTKEKK
jgi:hypothetical protein